jgi:hypothetical protein
MGAGEFSALGPVKVLQATAVNAVHLKSELMWVFISHSQTAFCHGPILDGTLVLFSMYAVRLDFGGASFPMVSVALILRQHRKDTVGECGRDADE